MGIQAIYRGNYNFEWSNGSGAMSAVCKGLVDLPTIQNYFANDWLAGYNRYIK